VKHFHPFFQQLLVQLISRLTLTTKGLNVGENVSQLAPSLLLGSPKRNEGIVDLYLVIAGLKEMR
jgi:hypothetical protein